LWDEFLYSMATEVRVLRYQTSCHRRFLLAFVFKSMAIKILIRRSKISDDLSAICHPGITIRLSSLGMKSYSI
jgi:hypothetical protein